MTVKIRRQLQQYPRGRGGSVGNRWFPRNVELNRPSFFLQSWFDFSQSSRLDSLFSVFDCFPLFISNTVVQRRVEEMRLLLLACLLADYPALAVEVSQSRDDSRVSSRINRYLIFSRYFEIFLFFILSLCSLLKLRVAAAAHMQPRRRKVRTKTCKRKKKKVQVLKKGHLRLCKVADCRLQVQDAGGRR